MSRNIPKWDDERTQNLLEAAGGQESPIPYTFVEEMADQLETSCRSVSAKLRKEGFEVQTASAARTKTFNDDQAAALEAFVTENSGQYTYAQIAEQFEGGAFNPKQIQGKILSMELTSHVAQTPKKVAERTYNPEEEQRILEMWKANAYIEDIAEALDREVASIRGKCLSMRDEMPEGTKLPVQRNRVVRTDPFDGLDIPNMTVEAIAEATDKSTRGVRSMLTRRGLTAADYDGAAKAAKRAESQEAA